MPTQVESKTLFAKASEKKSRKYSRAELPLFFPPPGGWWGFWAGVTDERGGDHIREVGDQLEIVVRRVAEVSRTVTIRPDGFISLPIVNEVQAAGSTAPELSAKLTKLLATRLINPEVTVIATQVRQAVVYVAGDVVSPTAVPVRNAANAMQAITLAGGLKRTAAASNITIVRLTPDGVLQAIAVNVDVKGQPGPYMALATTPLVADDIVFVPENKRSEVARFLDDIVNRPLTVVNGIVGTYVNFRLVSAIVGGA